MEEFILIFNEIRASSMQRRRRRRQRRLTDTTAKVVFNSRVRTQCNAATLQPHLVVVELSARRGDDVEERLQSRCKEAVVVVDDERARVMNDVESIMHVSRAQCPALRCPARVSQDE